MLYQVRLSLGRRLVNLLPVAQRNNAFTNGVVDRPWVVGREFESHVHQENHLTRGTKSYLLALGTTQISSYFTKPRKRFLKKSEIPHVKNLINHSPRVPRDFKELRIRHVRPHTKTKNPAVQKGGRELHGLVRVGDRLTFCQ